MKRSSTSTSARSRRSGGRALTRLERLEAEAILAEPTAFFIDHEAFHRSDAEATLFAEDRDLPMPDCSWYHPAMDDLHRGRPPRTVQVLTARQERLLFLRFNFARSRVAALQEALRTRRRDPRRVRELLRWHAQVAEVRDQIVRYNLALVLAMAKHVSSSNLDYAELISAGNVVLLNAVDKFDVGRGFKFSTYACRSILKAYSRMGIQQNRQNGLFPVSYDPTMEQPGDAEPPVDELDEYVKGLKQAWRSNAAELDDVERQVIRMRFCLGEQAPSEAMTLSQVGQAIGVTKECARQIQVRALRKLKQSLDERFDSPPFDG